MVDHGGHGDCHERLEGQSDCGSIICTEAVSDTTQIDHYSGTLMIIDRELVKPRQVGGVSTNLRSVVFTRQPHTIPEAPRCVLCFQRSIGRRVSALLYVCESKPDMSGITLIGLSLSFYFKKCCNWDAHSREFGEVQYDRGLQARDELSGSHVPNKTVVWSEFGDF